MGIRASRVRRLITGRDGVGGRDIVARVPVLVPSGSVEIFLDDLLPPREPVATAHAEIMAEALRTESAWTRIGASPECE